MHMRSRPAHTHAQHTCPYTCADLLTRSAKGGLFTPDELDLEDISEDFSLFPILLGGLAFRQGNLELFTIYYLARVLARINLQAMAVYQGRDAPMNPDVLVSQQEVRMHACLCVWHFTPHTPLFTGAHREADDG